MAIYSSVPPPSQAPPATAQPSSTSAIHAQAAGPGIDIESWTVSALQSLSVSPSARGTGVTLSIPLDSALKRDAEEKDPRASAKVHTVYKRKEPLRRDSQRRREALLKGKEGSRRRQRWENEKMEEVEEESLRNTGMHQHQEEQEAANQFLHVPNAQPPLPSDWAPHPTHTVNNVPYYLAPLWDAGIRHRAEENLVKKRLATAERNGFSETNASKGRVPQDLRMKLKKSKGAKTLLQDLEMEVRKFMKEYEAHSQHLSKSRPSSSSSSSSNMDGDSEDDEIVFIGRDANGNGITMSDEVKKVVEEELEREKKVYEGLEGSPEGGFARWQEKRELCGDQGDEVWLGWKREKRGVAETTLGSDLSVGCIGEYGVLRCLGLGFSLVRKSRLGRLSVP
ncbi:hypothetical protein EG329_003134 [Mollisiaceae sp. DMI_Dod_QoI]|nr:hypothetical protein EG329_003134 [Helotiales sp. DMI_Dod_QoI]